MDTGRRTGRSPSPADGAATRRPPAGGSFRLELGRAGSGWTPEQLAWATVGAAGGIFALALVAGSVGAAVPLACLAAVAPHVVLKLRAARRAKAFDEQLPDILDMLVGSLSVGHSFDQSLRAVADGASEPAATEFKHALGEIRLGRPAPAALADVAARLRSRGSAVRAHCGRPAAAGRRQPREPARDGRRLGSRTAAVPAEGTGADRHGSGISRAALIALPFLAGIGLSLMQPTYMQPMWQTTTGRELIVGALVFMAIGTYILKRIVSIGS